MIHNLCEICKKKSTKFFSFKNFPNYTINSNSKTLYSNKSFTLKLFFCNNCKNIFSSKKFQYQKLYKNHKAKSINIKNKINLIRRDLEKVIKLNKNDKIIEISKNIIFDKKYIRKKKLILKKIDLSKFNIPEKNSIKDIKLLICFDFLGNINNINKFFYSISKLLRDDGYIICEHHYGPSLLKNLTLDRIYSEHVNYFSIYGLNKLVVKNNLIIRKVNFYENKKFFRIIISKNNNNVNKKKINKIIKSEKKINLENIKLFKENINLISEKLSRFLNNTKFIDYKIYGFGTSIGALPIILHFKLEKKIKLLLDDYPLKNIYPINNDKIKILKFSKIKFKNKSIIILLAPRYLNFIKEKLIKKLRVGDIFINLLPKLKIIKKTN